MLLFIVYLIASIQIQNISNMGNKQLQHQINEDYQNRDNSWFEIKEEKIVHDRDTNETLLFRKIIFQGKIYQTVKDICEKRIKAKTEYIEQMKHYQIKKSKNLCSNYCQVDIFLRIMKGKISLAQSLKNQASNAKMTEKQISGMLNQILKGLKEFHELGSYFFNFTPQNIFYCPPDGKYFVGDPLMQKSKKMSNYQSPEFILHENDEIQYFCGFRSSLFSAGLIALELITGQKVQKDHQYHQIMSKTDRINLKQLKEKVILLINLNPGKRESVYYFIQNQIQRKNTNERSLNQQNLINQKQREIIKDPKLKSDSEVQDLSLKLKLANRNKRGIKYNLAHQQQQRVIDLKILTEQLNSTKGVTKSSRETKINQNPQNKRNQGQSLLKNIKFNNNNHKIKTRFRSEPSSRQNNITTQFVNKRNTINFNLPINKFTQNQSNQNKDFLNDNSAKIRFLTQNSQKDSCAITTKKHSRQSSVESEKIKEQPQTFNKNIQQFRLKQSGQKIYEKQDLASSLNSLNKIQTIKNITQKTLVDQLNSSKNIIPTNNHISGKNNQSSHSLNLQEQQDFNKGDSSRIKFSNYDISEVQIVFQRKKKANFFQNSKKQSLYSPKMSNSNCKVPNANVITLSRTQKVFEFKNGFKYVGECCEGMPNGQGKLFYPNQEIAYEGSWKNGLSHGKGSEYPISLTSSNTEDAINNEPDRNKQFSIPRKDSRFWIKFEGKFENGKREGLGTIKIQNGDIFRGNWKEDLVYGQGCYYKINGQLIKGIWKYNELIKRNNFN